LDILIASTSILLVCYTCAAFASLCSLLYSSSKQYIRKKRTIEQAYWVPYLFLKIDSIVVVSGLGYVCCGGLNSGEVAPPVFHHAIAKSDTR